MISAHCCSLIAPVPESVIRSTITQSLLPQDESAVLTSATEGWGIDALRQEIDRQLDRLRVEAGTAIVG